MAEDPQFEFAIRVAQIFSAVTFTLVAVWLSFANSTSMGYVQRASLEKRLTVSCFINTYVGMFSAFFNYFQLTEVDDLIMPESGNYTIDLARPIEWILTCPLMQLCLVLLGGTKIPEERRWLMPSLSVTVLLLGLGSTYLRGWIRFVPYILGCLTAGTMFYLNAKQVVEHSDGQENIISGDSEYRKATLLVIVLWFPFPLWYLMSPEGINFFSDPLLIQVGWSFLNIIAKFAFIFYVQRMKDNYCTKLKTKREMYQPRGISKELESQLTAVTIETLIFLGMAQNSDRLLSVMAKAGITTVEELEKMSQDECRDKMLPWDIIKAVQKRLRVWHLESHDTAEVDLENGETHYFKKTDIGEDDSTELGDEVCSLPALDNVFGSRPWSAGSTKSKRSSCATDQQVSFLATQSDEMNEKLQTLLTRLDDLEGVHAEGNAEKCTALLSKIEMLVDASTNRTERNIEELGSTLRQDVQGLGKRTLAISNEVQAGSKTQEASLADIRRQHMILMELISTDRDKMSSKIAELGSALNSKRPDAQSFEDTARHQAQHAFVGGNTLGSVYEHGEENEDVGAHGGYDDNN
eukprot:TRINITY_DN7890_c1_g1_i2.p1 TRINITY_DN7890_c1_g1~~TRINITY_DN7890_c1_g1_i2.p1  ORF type:complete len:594 (-),score=103.57 TRINITY_DN7890_c1_g1_i2:405-2138(-)